MGKKEQEERDRMVNLRPAVNICEEDGKVILKLEMPGVAKDGVELKIDNNELSIMGRRKSERIEGEYLLRERREGDFYQIYTVDETINRNKIEASMDSGILTVTLHLKEAEKPRQIEVKSD